MKQYPKIDTLFVRDEKFKLTDKLRHPVLADIAKWVVTEKVDGTNIRVSMEHGANSIEVGGRTDNAQIHGDLIRNLYAMLPTEKMRKLFNPDSVPSLRITLFGEGYGAGIQKGGYYRADKSFILFDVLIESDEGAWWQDDDTVTEFAERLGIDRVPIIGEWSLGEIVRRVREGVVSEVVMTMTNTPLAEGVVARTREPLFDKRGRRLILKLKTKDFE